MRSVFGAYSSLVYPILLALCCGACIWGNFIITIVVVLLTMWWFLDGICQKSFQTIWSRKSVCCFLLIPLIVMLRMCFQLPDSEACMYIGKYLPLLVFIWVIGSKPAVIERQFHLIMLLFVASIVVHTVVCCVHYVFCYDENTNVRALSWYMSHIRLSLFIVVSIAICFYYLLYNSHNELFAYEKKCLVLAVVWLTIFIIILKSLTGYFLLAVLFLFVCMETLSKKWLKLSVVFVLIIGLLSVIWSEARYFILVDDFVETESTTSLENCYTAEWTPQVENGHQVGVYICTNELDQAWQEREGSSVWEKNENNVVPYYVLVRYMTSKNLRKDYADFQKLREDDIDAVKHGYTNYRFTSSKDPRKRIYETCWEVYEYVHGGNPNGHSLTQRFEFVKCALQAIQQHWFVGVGADARSEMAKFYDTAENRLEEKNWNLPHNQFVLMGLFSGVIGFVLFLFALFGIMFFSEQRNNFIVKIWFIVVVVSCLTEDTFNTAAGQVLTGLLGAVLLYAQPKNGGENENSCRISVES